MAPRVPGIPQRLFSFAFLLRGTIVFFFCLFASIVSFAATLDRDSDPVIMEGSELGRLTGLDPDRIVEFKYVFGWIQIPVQVDERALNDFGIVYNSDPRGLVTIDGSPADPITPGPIVWEMVTGTQGTLIHASVVDTDIPGFSYTSYYLDDSTPPVTQCTGDDHAYGSNGLWINVPIPNTDPALGAHNHFVVTRMVFIEPPSQSAALAAQRSDQAKQPLLASASPPTAVETQTPPPRCYLAQNIPNPFKTETRVRFEVPLGEPLSVRVYGVDGKLVRTLFSGTTADGRGTAVWDGRDENHRGAATGIYFCRLETGRFTTTRKIVLLE